jgi:hypothetical protein
MHSLPWRVGRSVGRTIYDANGVLLGTLDTPELAAFAVAAVNGTARPFVPGPPSNEYPCNHGCGAEQGSHRDCPVHGLVPWKRTSLAPSPDYRIASDPEPCGCEETEALRARLAKAEARARAWHQLARYKHRLLHGRERVGQDSQLTRPVQGE